jgi:hypothetical protein
MVLHKKAFFCFYASILKDLKLKCTSNPQGLELKCNCLSFIRVKYELGGVKITAPKYLTCSQHYLALWVFRAKEHMVSLKL